MRASVNGGARTHTLILARAHAHTDICMYIIPHFDLTPPSSPHVQTVAAMDVLVPRIGELIGGSQREERPEVLIARSLEAGVDPKVRPVPLPHYHSIIGSLFGSFLATTRCIHTSKPKPNLPRPNSTRTHTHTHTHTHNLGHVVVQRPSQIWNGAPRRLRSWLRTSHHVRHWARKHP